VPVTLLLVDGPSAWFRAFHGVPTSVVAPDGSPVNAVRGFVDVLARQITNVGADHLLVCLDASWRPEFRVAALPSYKAHRVGPEGDEPGPPGLAPQVEVLLELLGALGIRTLGVDGFEADDVIAAAAERAAGHVVVVTGDRDLFQLVRDDKPVVVAYAVERYRLIDEAAITEKYEIPGRAYASYALLRGDASDGLPGVAGIGAKTAAALLRRFGDIDGILRALGEGDAGFPAGARRRLLDAAEYVTAAREVVWTRTDLDLPADVVDGSGLALTRVPADPDRVAALTERWGLGSSVARLLRALLPAGTADALAGGPPRGAQEAL
jgi:5'-3' exonuclease